MFSGATSPVLLPRTEKFQSAMIAGCINQNRLAAETSRAKIAAAGGRFLDASQPDTSPAPSALDCSILGTGFSSLAPALKQAFFIGDGLTGTGSGSSELYHSNGGNSSVSGHDGWVWMVQQHWIFRCNCNPIRYNCNPSFRAEPVVALTLGVSFFGIVRHYLLRM
jgi:hypothetical protein